MVDQATLLFVCLWWFINKLPSFFFFSSSSSSSLSSFSRFSSISIGNLLLRCLSVSSFICLIEGMPLPSHDHLHHHHHHHQQQLHHNIHHHHHLSRHQRTLEETREQSSSSSSPVDGTTYLMKFGYLPGSDLETGALRTDEELKRAVKHFQKFAHIPETGRLDASTMEAMKKPRCGIADLIQGQGHHRSTDSGIGPPSGYTLGPSKWQKKWLTVRILNFTPDLSYHQIRDAFIRALYVWSDVTQLSFHEVQSGHADIYVQFSSGYHQDGYPFDGPGMVLAHAFFPGDERGGDIHFDEDENWTTRSENGVDLFIVAAHELGHSLGLAHSNVPGSLMYPWHQGYKQDFKLHPDDITAIQYLYGAKTAYPPPNSPPPPSAGGPPSSTTSVVPTFNSRTTQSTSRSTSLLSRTTTSIASPTTPRTFVTTALASPTRSTGVIGEGDRATHRPNGGLPPRVPDPCLKIDALSVIRGETFLFSGKWFWRINDAGIMDGYPVEIVRFWYGFPNNLDRIDALFERSSDGRIVFFSGKRYWEFHGNYLALRFPMAGRPLSDLGLPTDVEKVDAAFVWRHNRRTYLITGQMYWKLNETSQGVESYSYPRDMSMWNGVPVPVDAAFTHTDGYTYFFQGLNFWEFNNARMQVRSNDNPKRIGDRWLKCAPNRLPETTDGSSDNDDDDDRMESDEPTSSSAYHLHRPTAYGFLLALTVGLVGWRLRCF